MAIEKTLKEIQNINNIRLQKIKLKMDLTLLDSIIAFIYKESVLRTRKSLNNTYKLFQIIDLSIYEKIIGLWIEPEQDFYKITDIKQLTNKKL